MDFNKELSRMSTEINQHHFLKQNEICQKHLEQIVDQLKWHGLDFKLFKNEIILNYYQDKVILAIYWYYNEMIKNVNIVFNFNFDGSNINEIDKNRIEIKPNSIDNNDERFNIYFDNCIKCLNENIENIQHGLIYNMAMSYATESLRNAQDLNLKITIIEKKFKDFSEQDNSCYRYL